MRMNLSTVNVHATIVYLPYRTLRNIPCLINIVQHVRPSYLLCHSDSVTQAGLMMASTLPSGPNMPYQGGAFQGIKLHNKPLSSRQTHIVKNKSC